MRTGAKNVRARPFRRFRRFRILKRILDIGHGKTKYSLTIYLTTKKISAKSECAQLKLIFPVISIVAMIVHSSDFRNIHIGWSQRKILIS